MHCVVAGMSEDSDYTSDINYPVHHQSNTSAHQFRGEHNAYLSPREDSRDGGDYYAGDYYEGADAYDRGASFDQDTSLDRGASLDRGRSFERGYDDQHRDGYERDQDLYGYRDSPYHQPPYTGGDTDSEPLYLSYNSQPYARPQSFSADR